MTNKEYYKRFKKEIIYLWEDEAECYIKSTPNGGGYFAKYPGKTEFKIGASTGIVVRAIHAKKSVQKQSTTKPNHLRFFLFPILYIAKL